MRCTDVFNEVDVLKLNGYILTFISCKDKFKVDKSALYELDFVASRFGGKYAKKKLICSGKLTKAEKERAKLMGIEFDAYA